MQKAPPRRFPVDLRSLDASLSKVPAPEGFNPRYYDPAWRAEGERKGGAPADQDALKLKKAWEAATAPAKSIPMNALMLWMSGSGVQIFSIMMLYMLFNSGVQGAMRVGQVFERFAVAPQGASRADPLLLPKLVYLALHAALVALGLWKMSSMGLLPTAQSDWLAFLPPKNYMEFSAGGALT